MCCFRDDVSILSDILSDDAVDRRKLGILSDILSDDAVDRRKLEKLN